jgi:hypothetical protein
MLKSLAWSGEDWIYGVAGSAQFFLSGGRVSRQMDRLRARNYGDMCTSHRNFGAGSNNATGDDV